MTDTPEFYPGYDPKIDPYPVTCWGYGTWIVDGLWAWYDCYWQEQLMLREIMLREKEEYLKANPQFISP